VLGRDEHDIMDSLAGNIHTRYIKRLCVNVAVDGKRKQFPELPGIDVLGCKDLFYEIRAGSRRVVLGRRHRNLRPGGRNGE